MLFNALQCSLKITMQYFLNHIIYSVITLINLFFLSILSLLKTRAKTAPTMAYSDSWRQSRHLLTVKIIISSQSDSQIVSQSRKGHEEVMWKSCENHDIDMRKHRKVMRKSLESHKKVMRKSWESLDMSWESYEKFIRKSWESFAKVRRKSLESHKKVMRNLLTVMRKS